MLAPEALYWLSHIPSPVSTFSLPSMPLLISQGIKHPQQSKDSWPLISQNMPFNSVSNGGLRLCVFLWSFHWFSPCLILIWEDYLLFPFYMQAIILWWLKQYLTTCHKDCGMLSDKADEKWLAPFWIIRGINIRDRKASSPANAIQNLCFDWHLSQHTSENGAFRSPLGEFFGNRSFLKGMDIVTISGICTYHHEECITNTGRVGKLRFLLIWTLRQLLMQFGVRSFLWGWS